MENEDLFDGDNEELQVHVNHLDCVDLDQVDDFFLSQNKTIDIICEEKDDVLKKEMEHYSEII